MIQPRCLHVISTLNFGPAYFMLGSFLISGLCDTSRPYLSFLNTSNELSYVNMCSMVNSGIFSTVFARSNACDLYRQLRSYVAADHLSQIKITKWVSLRVISLISVETCLKGFEGSGGDAR